MTDLHVAMLGPVDLTHLREVCGARGTTSDPAPGDRGAVPLATLSHAVGDLGVRLTVVTLGTSKPEISIEEVSDSITVIAVPARVTGRGRDFNRVERRMLSSVLAGLDDVDLVHAHWTYEYALAALEGRQRPVLVSVHDWAPAILRHGPHPYNVMRLGSQLYVTRRTRFLTANSPYIMQRLRRLGRDPYLLPNPISDDSFDVLGEPMSRKSESCRILAINNGFGGRKNVSTLLRAFALVRRALPQSSLLLVGHGHEENGVARRWAMEHGLDSAVDFLGPQAPSKVRELLATATVLAHPSLEESFGMVLVEAMAAGVPIVAGERSGAVPWVVGDAGVLCDVSQPSLLAQALSAVLRSPSTQASLHDAGRRHTWERFRAKAVAGQAVDIYQRVLRGRAASR